MKAAVLGAGSWGTTFALVLAAAYPFKVDRDLFIVAVLLGLRSVQFVG